MYYVSTLLEQAGTRHAFSTRIGGTMDDPSPPPFDSFNLGNPNGCEVQDEYPRIYGHYALLQEAIGCADRQRMWVHQVHGRDIARIPRGQPFHSGCKADGIVSDDPTRILSVRTADCVPVLISSGDGKIVAAVHAGWRGVIANIVPDAVAVITEMGGAECVAAIGPCIGFDAFEVGPEVIEAFRRSGDDVPIHQRKDGKGHVDLRAAIRYQLRHKGLAENRVDVSDRCTFRDREEFYSHRRDRGITGRMAAIISPRNS